ncbi:MAG: glycosyltransferase family A protein [bacterium]|nr:glycosyltransferase family A protein [bacterium]
MMPKVSIVIPTCNRLDLLPRAIRSVLAQTYQDFEIIVVDDGTKERADVVVAGFSDPRTRYIKNETSLGGGGARNRGIKEARGEYIALLDDDDEWLPDKLRTQMNVFEAAPQDVGFCFSSVTNVFSDHEETTHVEDGIFDFSQIVLTRFKGFLTSTLVVRTAVFAEMGGFDESLPSHQEPELIIRFTRKYRGIGINQPLVRMNMTPHEHIGGDIHRRIRGKELVLQKHAALYAKYPHALAKQYFWLALWYRDSGQMVKAKGYFWKAFRLSGNPRYFGHWLLAFA